MSLAAERALERILDEAAFTGTFFLYGDATRPRDDAARALSEAAVDESLRDFNLDVFRGAEASAEALAAAIAMPPVMAPRRVVAVYGAEKLSRQAGAVLEKAAGGLPADVTLIVTATIPSGSKRSLYRVLKKSGATLEWRSPAEEELPGWLIERARTRYGAELSPPAAEALASAVGLDLSLLEAELEKVCAASDGPVSLERVSELVPNIRAVNRWAWLDRVTGREYAAARKELPALLAAGENPIGLIGNLVDGHVLVGLALHGGASTVERALVEAGRANLRFKARVFARQARLWTEAEIDEALRCLRVADARAKSPAGDEEALETLLLELECRARARTLR